MLSALARRRRAPAVLRPALTRPFIAGTRVGDWVQELKESHGLAPSPPAPTYDESVRRFTAQLAALPAPATATERRSLLVGVVYPGLESLLATYVRERLQPACSLEYFDDRAKVLVSRSDKHSNSRALYFKLLPDVQPSSSSSSSWSSECTAAGDTAIAGVGDEYAVREVVLRLAKEYVEAVVAPAEKVRVKHGARLGLELSRLGLSRCSVVKPSAGEPLWEMLSFVGAGTLLFSVLVLGMAYLTPPRRAPEPARSLTGSSGGSDSGSSDSD